MASIVELATELSVLKRRKEELGAEETVINKRIEEISRKELPDVMDADGVSNIKIEGVGRVSLRGEVFVSILAENRQAAYQWLRDTGRGSLITETVNASTLKAASKEWIKNGEEIPESLIKITPITVAVLSTK